MYIALRDDKYFHVDIQLCHCFEGRQISFYESPVMYISLRGGKDLHIKVNHMYIALRGGNDTNIFLWKSSNVYFWDLYQPRYNSSRQVGLLQYLTDEIFSFHKDGMPLEIRSEFSLYGDNN